MDKKSHAIELRKNGKSLIEIMNEVEAPKGTVYGWIKGIPYIRDRKAEAQKSWQKRRNSHPSQKELLPHPAKTYNNTKQKGDVSEAIVLAELIKAGKTVLQPFGDNARYDMAVDLGNGKIQRIQCKTARLKRGAIIFQSSSSYSHRGYGRKTYTGEIDAFGIHCPEVNKCFLIPIEETKNQTTFSLRYTEALNGNKLKTIHEYLIK